MARGHADIHLVCGPTGAGKSTYAEELARAMGGVRFSIDEWMQCLHNADKQAEMSFDWFYERVQRNCAQMREMAQQLVRLDVPAVFDCGLTNLRERDIFVDWAQENGFSTQLHFRDVPEDIRWTRVRKRNRERAETFQFEVTREMFDFIGGLWEAPTDEEMAHLSGIRVTD